MGVCGLGAVAAGAGVLESVLEGKVWVCGGGWGGEGLGCGWLRGDVGRGVRGGRGARIGVFEDT